MSSGTPAGTCARWFYEGQLYDFARRAMRHDLGGDHVVDTVRYGSSTSPPDKIWTGNKTQDGGHPEWADVTVRRRYAALSGVLPYQVRVRFDPRLSSREVHRRMEAVGYGDDDKFVKGKT